MCSGFEDSPGGITLDAKSTPDGRKKGPEDHGRSHEDDWGHAPSEGSVSGNAVDPLGVARARAEKVSCI